MTIVCKDISTLNYKIIEYINLNTKYYEEIIYDKKFTTLTLWGLIFPFLNKTFFQSISESKK